MGDKSKIEWTDATWNVLRGCSMVSDGCTNCYAMRQAHRQKNGAYKGLTRLGPNGPVWTGDVRLVPEMLDYPLRLRKSHMIFVNSMSDLFHESLTIEQVAAIFQVMHQAHWHVFQVLTKRPKRMLEFCQALAVAGKPNGIAWPFPNVWLGVSCEDQKTADERIPLLLQTPAAVRWISAEPLLGPVELRQANADPHFRRSWLEYNQRVSDGKFSEGTYNRLDWVVVGGESGPGARPMHPDWARSLRDQCIAADVPFFFKQGSKANWPHYKDFDSFPVDLRLRQYPETANAQR